MPVLRPDRVVERLRYLVVDHSTYEPLRDFRLRPAEHVQHISFLDDLSAFHDSHPVADQLDYLHLVGDQHDRDPHFPVDPFQQLQDGFRRLRVQRAGRLVAQQDLRRCRQRPCDADALLLPAGKLADVGILLVAQLHEVEHLGNPPLDLLLRPSFHPQRDRDIVENRFPFQKVELLENHPDLPPQGCQRLSLQAGQLLPVYPDRSAVRRFQPVHQPDQGRFSGAGKPDDPVDLPLADMQAHVLQGPDLHVLFPERPGYVFQSDHCASTLFIHSSCAATARA